MYGTYMKMLFILKCMDLYSALPGLKLGDTGTLPFVQEYTKLFVTKCPFSFFLLSSYFSQDIRTKFNYFVLNTLKLSVTEHLKSDLL